MYGVDDFKAIVSPPEAAILAVGAVQRRVVVKGGQVEVGQAVQLNLSCDHRVVYGAEAATFLGDLRTLLEQPAACGLRSSL
jgi:pyruvate dehydrogenase E2 component (dihydrolipoamide acetyltransferase)